MNDKKRVIMNKLVLRYTQKVNSSVPELIKDIDDGARSVPKAIRQHIKTMSSDVTEASIARELAAITKAATETANEVKNYDPVEEIKNMVADVSDAAKEYAAVVVETVKDVAEAVVEEAIDVATEVVVEKVEDVVESAVALYTEEELRLVFEAAKLVGNYTTILKKIKADLEPARIPAELLIVLAKEYATKK